MLLLGGLDRLDPPQLDLFIDPGLGEQFAQPRQHGLMAGTAGEVEHLDPHGFAAFVGFEAGDDD